MKSDSNLLNQNFVRPIIFINPLNQNFPKPIIFVNPLNQNLLKNFSLTFKSFLSRCLLRISKTEYVRERVLPRASETNVSVKVRRRDREERTKTLETKKREKNFWV
jgi:hypothetical protein